MKLPYLQELDHVLTRPLVFAGLNQQELIDDNELSGGANLDTNNLPAISPRDSMVMTRNTFNPFVLKSINNKIVLIDGTDFYYDGVLKGQVTPSNKSIVDFNGNIVIFPDLKYYDYIGDVFGAFICPYEIEYATVHYNRIFGIKGSNVYASKVGDFKVWDDYSGTELDSWAADVYSPGDFTGITSYQDHVVFFKSDQMYELYGYTPSQFKILESAKVGCVDNKSIAEVNGVLYFAAPTGIYTYSGGFPRAISEKLNIKHIDKATAIGVGDKYFVCLYGVIYVYDMAKVTWLPYAEKDVIEFAKIENDVYVLTTDIIGNPFNGFPWESYLTEEFEWVAETKEYDDGTFRKKSIKAIKLKMKIEEGTNIKVYLRQDGGEYVLRKDITHTGSNRNREVITTIPLKRASTYQIKIVGKGKALIYGEREFIVGSDK